MPHVTAVMITGKNGTRQRLAENAVRCFMEQSHPDRDLLIVNDSRDTPHEYSLLAPESVARWGGENRPAGMVEELLLRPKSSLGALRNIGLDAAKGDYIIQLDDDDWSHPSRISYQLEHAVKDRCVLLTRQVRYNLLRDTAFVFANTTDGIAGTILHPKTEIRYPLKARSEDATFFQQAFDSRVIRVDNRAFPHVYLRFYHGNNTWHESHVMKIHSGARAAGRWIREPARNGLSRASEQYLTSVLAAYYKPGLAPVA